MIPCSGVLHHCSCHPCDSSPEASKLQHVPRKRLHTPLLWRWLIIRCWDGQGAQVVRRPKRQESEITTGGGSWRRLWVGALAVSTALWCSKSFGRCLRGFHLVPRCVRLGFGASTVGWRFCLPMVSNICWWSSAAFRMSLSCVRRYQLRGHGLPPPPPTTRAIATTRTGERSASWVGGRGRRSSSTGECRARDNNQQACAPVQTPLATCAAATPRWA